MTSADVRALGHSVWDLEVLSHLSLKASFSALRIPIQNSITLLLLESYTIIKAKMANNGQKGV